MLSESSTSIEQFADAERDGPAGGIAVAGLVAQGRGAAMGGPAHGLAEPGDSAERMAVDPGAPQAALLP